MKDLNGLEIYYIHLTELLTWLFRFFKGHTTLIENLWCGSISERGLN